MHPVVEWLAFRLGYVLFLWIVLTLLFGCATVPTHDVDMPVEAHRFVV